MANTDLLNELKTDAINDFIHFFLKFKLFIQICLWLIILFYMTQFYIFAPHWARMIFLAFIFRNLLKDSSKLFEKLKGVKK